MAASSAISATNLVVFFERLGIRARATNRNAEKYRGVPRYRYQSPLTQMYLVLAEATGMIYHRGLFIYSFSGENIRK